MNRDTLRRQAKREAIAFRVWQYAEPRGWDVTLQELADALGEGAHTVGRAVKRKGWTSHLRSTRKSLHGVFLVGFATTLTLTRDIEEIK